MVLDLYDWHSVRTDGMGSWFGLEDYSEMTERAYLKAWNQGFKEA